MELSKKGIVEFATVFRVYVKLLKRRLETEYSDMKAEE